MTYIRASELGCALDCDLRHGRNKHTGGAATDDGPRINAAMAKASADHPITLIIDGSALVSGLFFPVAGHWGIAGLGCGTGFYVKAGTNNDGIHNGPANNWGGYDQPPPPRGSNVRLSNFTLNGNAGDGRRGNSTTGDPRGNTVTGPIFFGIQLKNLEYITIENVVVVDSPCNHIHFDNVGNVNISGCVTSSLGPNTDGFHFNGPANDITISGCTFTTGDDAIALNCPEGYSGNISRVTITDCKFNNTPSLMRLDTIHYPLVPEKFYIDAVTVRNCTGTVQNSCFEIGDGAGSNPQSVESLTISDSSLSAPALLNIWANFGTIALKNVTLMPPKDNRRAAGHALAQTDLRLLNPDSGIYFGTKLSIENCVISGSGDSGVAALILENDSIIDGVEINGFSVDGCEAQELINIVSGTIGELVINSLNTKNIKAALSTGGFSKIGTVSGAGVLATGWPFPDAVMANGVPYISANTGRPSIKVGGVVRSYP